MNLLDLLLILIVAASLIAGFAAGFARAGIGFFAAIGGIVCAFWFYGTPAAAIHKYVASTTVCNVVGFLVVFLLCLTIGALIAKLLSRLFKWTGLSWLDHVLGAGFGLIRGALVAVAFIAVLMAFTPSPPPNWMVGSALLPYAIDASNVIAALAPSGLKIGFHQTMAEIQTEWNDQIRRAEQHQRERDRPREPEKPSDSDTKRKKTVR